MKSKHLIINLIIFILISFIGFTIYFQTLNFNYSYLDDQRIILENSHLFSKISNIPNLFTDDVFRSNSNFYYRPLLLLSYMLDFQHTFKNARGYHLTNLIIHILTAFLVFLFFKTFNFHQITSFLTAIIFLIHPILAQAVAWIPGRNDLLLTLFFLLSFLSWVKFLKINKKFYFLIHLLFFFCSLLTKESAILFPIIYIAYYFLYQKAHKLNINLIKSIFIINFWLILYFIYFILKSIAHIQNFYSSYLFSSFIQNAPAFIQFFGKIFFPFNQNPTPTIIDTPFWPGLIAIFIASFALIFIWKKSNTIFGLLIYILFITPPLFIYQTYHHENRLYLPIIGVLLFCLEALRFFKKHIYQTSIFSKKASRIKLKQIAYFTYFILIIFLIYQNINYTPIFNNRLTFWKCATSKSPHASLAQKNLGAMYFLNNQLDKAQLYYQKAVQLNPYEPMIYNNLALIQYQKGNYKKAEQLYLQELKYNPNWVNTYYNLSLLYLKQNQKQKAISYLQKSLEIDKKYLPSLLLLASIYKNKDSKIFKFYINQIKKIGYTAYEK